MSSAWVRVRDRVLPAPGRRELPKPVPFRRMIGPSVILAGLSVGSGEFVLWPRLTAEFGFALFWACWIGVTIQFFLNMEIERWTLVTGESAVVGFIRLGRVFAPIFLLCGTLPWVWPGWATGAATLLHWEFGWPVLPVAVASLIGCGLVLSLGPVVYRTMEVIQLALVAGIVLLLVALALVIVRLETVVLLFEGAARIGTIPDGIALPLLFSALAFAGAGGSVNLAQSNYINDKGYGMGHWIGRITSPFTGRDEAAGHLGYVFDDTEENRARWRVWWRRTNAEHFASFFVLCLLSLALFCLIAATLLGDAPVADGLGFIADEAAALDARFGSGARNLFLAVGVAVLFTTELALLDAVSRVAADVLKQGILPGTRWSLSQLYFAVVWSLIAFGIAVLAAGFDQPLTLLILSATLNGFVMFLYSGLLLWMNTTSLSGPLRPSALRIAALVGAIVFFGYFSVLTLVDQLSRIGAAG
jgi:hypothetical protein